MIINTSNTPAHTNSPTRFSYHQNELEQYSYKNLLCKSFDLLKQTKFKIGNSSWGYHDKAKSKRSSKIHFSLKTKETLRSCRQAFYQITTKSNTMTPTAIKTARRAPWRAIRVANASTWNKLYKSLMELNDNKDVIMFKLINRQRNSKRPRHSHYALRVDGQIINNQKGLLKAWANHFHHLGTQTEQSHFDPDHTKKESPSVKKMHICISAPQNPTELLHPKGQINYYCIILYCIALPARKSTWWSASLITTKQPTKEEWQLNMWKKQYPTSFNR